MKIGLSTYSLVHLLRSGEMTLLDAVDWVKENGGEHIELTPIGFTLTDNSELTDAVREKAAQAGLEISNYAVGANFAVDSEEELEREISRVLREVDTAHRLGVKRMRHDAATRKDTSLRQFLADLKQVADACRRIADYAAGFGIITSVENHGYYLQASDRVQALLLAVDRPNFRTTLDIGNFLCVDEDPLSAVRNNLPFASMVHLKDFYVRPAGRNPGQGWFPSSSGRYLRGAVLGHGDIELYDVMGAIKQSGYDGYLSVEFEGMEDGRLGSRLGMANAVRIWNEV